ncbi:hypothetical protein ABT300_00960 [Streptomyces sp. NPDC001027]|uniref:hypothetical protein n=1 Tax=Streptomyces sp. NPDC001027 TaxID=3154771 RepID=UPI0033318D21
MTTYIGAVFNNGFVARLLDLSIRLNVFEGDDLVREIARLCRTAQRGPGSSWALPSATAAATVDLVAEVLASPLRDRLPAGFEEKLALASGGRPSAEYLSDAALAIRRLDGNGIPGYGQLPMASWEVPLTFPELVDFTYWVETDEFETLDDCLRAGFDSLHPGDCADKAVGLVAQAQEALLLFPEPDTLRTTLSQGIPWASRSVLREIARKGNRHFAEFHDIHSR